MKTSEHLRKALENIQTYGWIKGSLGNEMMGFCSVGSVVRACTGCAIIAGHDVKCGACYSTIFLLCDMVREEGFTHTTSFYDIVEYNDHVATSQEDVLLLFKKAIERAEEQED